MKTLQFFSVIFLFVLLSSCNNSDNPGNEPQGIEGYWKLVQVTGGIAGTVDTFEDTTVNWAFNANGSVSVFNTNTDDTKVDFMDSGDYIYSFMPNPTEVSCDEALFIDGVSFGCHSIDGNILTLSQVENDGYEVTLEKIVFSTTE